MKAIAPVAATYRYYEYNYADGTATPMFTPVEVVGESVKSLYIKIGIFIRGYRPGDIMRVARKSVDFGKAGHDYTNAWWNR